MRINTTEDGKTFCITDIVGAYEISLSFRMVKDNVWFGDIRVWLRSDNRDVTAHVFGPKFGGTVPYTPLNHALAITYCMAKSQS